MDAIFGAASSWLILEFEIYEPVRLVARGGLDKQHGGEQTIMRTRQARVRGSSLLGFGLATCLLTGCSFEQILIGQIYTITTPQTGGCPRLAWRFVVSPGRLITGSLTGDGQQPIATLSGVLHADDRFHITATDVAARRTAEVTGQFTSLVSTISIQGDAAGPGCDGQTFKLRLGGYFSRQGGGGGGGN